MNWMREKSWRVGGGPERKRELPFPRVGGSGRGGRREVETDSAKLLRALGEGEAEDDELLSSSGFFSDAANSALIAGQTPAPLRSVRTPGPDTPAPPQPLHHRHRQHSSPKRRRRERSASPRPSEGVSRSPSPLPRRSLHHSHHRARSHHSQHSGDRRSQGREDQQSHSRQSQQSESRRRRSGERESSGESEAPEPPRHRHGLTAHPGLGQQLRVARTPGTPASGEESGSEEGGSVLSWELVGPGARPPTFRYPGWDLHASVTTEIPAGGYQTVDTGLGLRLPRHAYAVLHSRLDGPLTQRKVVLASSGWVVEGACPQPLRLLLHNLRGSPALVSCGTPIALLVLHHAQRPKPPPASAHRAPTAY